MDMSRIGLFSEMGYISIGDTYKDPLPAEHRKGKGFYVPGRKEVSATQDGYFNEAYHRIMEGEAYSDPVKLERQNKLDENKKNIGKSFIPASGFKDSCGVGSYYGTIGGPIASLSPVLKPNPPLKRTLKNILTAPSKKGTGYGYLEVTLNPYPKHIPDPYSSCKEDHLKSMEYHKKAMKYGPFKLNMHPDSYFMPNPYKQSSTIAISKSRSKLKEVIKNKKPIKPFIPSNYGHKDGGMKAGTFDPYPSHSDETYVKLKDRPIHVVNQSGRVFIPLQREKSRPTNSILHQNVMKSMNSQNYKTVETVMSY